MLNSTCSLTRLKTVSGGGQLKMGGDMSDFTDNDCLSAAAVSGSGSSETFCFFNNIISFSSYFCLSLFLF